MNRACITHCILLTMVLVPLMGATPHLFAQQGLTSYPDLLDEYGLSQDAYELYIRNISPSPGEKVFAEIHSLGESVNSIRTIQWSADGEVLNEFANKRKASILVDNSPREVTAKITYFDTDGKRIQTSITDIIRPIIFDILWEGDSVTTPRYNGHKLAGPRVPIRLSAHIQYIDQNGALHTEKDFSFLWEIESRYQDERGPEARSITYKKGGSYFNDSLFVRGRASLIKNTDVVVERAITIPITDPRLLIYPYTLLYGLSYNRVVPKTVNVAGDSAILSVYPFYFNKTDFDENAIQYQWFIKNKPAPLNEGRKIDISITGQLLSVPLLLYVSNKNEREQSVEGDIIFNV